VTIVLDSWAVLALLRGEPSGPYVRDRIAAERSVISWVNLGEVLYLESRRVGASRADLAVSAVTDVIDAELPDVELVRAAAARKSVGGLSYADAFAVATAERHRGPLLTGDPEIVALADRALEVIDLRRH
jgi:predicted nucleic acid-binding protein